MAVNCLLNDFQSLSFPEKVGYALMSIFIRLSIVGFSFVVTSLGIMEISLIESPILVMLCKSQISSVSSAVQFDGWTPFLWM